MAILFYGRLPPDAKTVIFLEDHNAAVDYLKLIRRRISAHSSLVHSTQPSLGSEYVQAALVAGKF